MSNRERITRLDGLGVLKVFQLRARHAFAAYNSSTTESLLSESGQVIQVRHNSTTVHAVSEADTASPPPHPPTKQQTVQLEEAAIVGHELLMYKRLQSAYHSRNQALIHEEVERYRAQENVSLPCYNMALKALWGCHVAGDPITLLLELYNEMLQRRGLIPNLVTYQIMIEALCARDYEVHRVVEALQETIARRHFLGLPEHENTADEQRIATLKGEGNFQSALRLFHTAITVRNKPLGLKVYNGLLRACANHNDVDTALRVFAHMERFPDEVPTNTIFLWLLTLYHNVRDLRVAERVFGAFRNALANGRVKPIGDGESKPSTTFVYNRMIDTYFICGEPGLAVELFESMISTPLGTAYKISDPPLPNSYTYNSIISGFCKTGDFDSALKWFDQLLKQGDIVSDYYAPLTNPPRPNIRTWNIMFENLAVAGRIEPLQRLWKQFLETKEKDGFYVGTTDAAMVLHANMKIIEDPKAAKDVQDVCIKFVREYILDINACTPNKMRIVVPIIAEILFKQGDIEGAISLMERFFVTEQENAKAEGEEAYQSHLHRLRKFYMSFVDEILASLNPSSLDQVPVKQALRIAALADMLDLTPNIRRSLWIVRLYTQSRDRGESLEFTQGEQMLLLDSFARLDQLSVNDSNVENNESASNPISEHRLPGLATFLTDLEPTDFSIEKLESIQRRKIARTLALTHGIEEAKVILHNLGPKFAPILAVPPFAALPSRPQAGTEALPLGAIKQASNVIVDLYHTRYVNEWFPTNPNVSLHMAYDRFITGIKNGRYPSPECIGRLIGGFGRLGDRQKVNELYGLAQNVLSSLEDRKNWQHSAWFEVEDSMIVGLAHAGDHGTADIHRNRIIQAGGTPSSDAYGALISSLKDTTDDAGFALQYWEDALARGVRPNVFMYNTIISKLSKARKADLALKIFSQMRGHGVHPSAVTYGAIIAAACRVGDCQAAEAFFEEMSRLPNYKPRAAPYNTMMQLYIHTKPDQDRALHFYNALLRDKVSPTEHTFRVSSVDEFRFL